MGLFSRKEKVGVDDMAKDMMRMGLESVGKMKSFDDLDAEYSLAVNLGYFYGFLRLHLAHITKLDTANSIIMKSIGHLESITKGKTSEEFGYTVRTMLNNANENIKYATQELKDNPIKGVGLLYYVDLHKSTTINMDKIADCEKNMFFLYGRTSELLNNIKIVK